ncbi:hypothetical protein SNEBB_008199 [Seison nebaliae]|nr:hypothetical protein SNEBB_008199 [Seison nebaliae]
MEAIKLLENYINMCRMHEVQPNKRIAHTLQNQTTAKLETDTLDASGNNVLIEGPRINDDDLKFLLNVLKEETKIKRLSLRFNRITDLGAQMLAEFLKADKSITHLDLMGNDIGEEGARELGIVLEKNGSVIFINLNGNPLGKFGGIHFAKMLRINVTLKSLDLSDTNSHIETLIAITTALRTNKNLLYLNINRPITNNELESSNDIIPVHIGRMLNINCCLEELHVQKMHIKDFGCSQIIEALSKNIFLTHIDFSCNKITRDGARCIAIYLESDPPLRVLDLGYNRIESQGTHFICDVMKFSNKTLETLVLRSNNITTKGLGKITEMLLSNTTLINIYVWGNKFDEASALAFKGIFDAGRLKESQTDIRFYDSGGRPQIAEVSHAPNIWYYWKPYYGDDAKNNPFD